MESQQIEQYKKRLQKELQELAVDLKRHGRVINEETQDWVASIEPQDKTDEDITVEGDRMADYEVGVALLTKLEERLLKVKNALGRIKDGTYGVDVETGEPIKHERLEADPAATKNI